MNSDSLVLGLDQASQPADVRVQDDLSIMFQSMGISLWCAIREQGSGDLHTLIFKLPGTLHPEQFKVAGRRPKSIQ